MEKHLSPAEEWIKLWWSSDEAGPGKRVCRKWRKGFQADRDWSRRQPKIKGTQAMIGINETHSPLDVLCTKTNISITVQLCLARTLSMSNAFIFGCTQCSWDFCVTGHNCMPTDEFMRLQNQGSRESNQSIITFQNESEKNALTNSLNRTLRIQTVNTA